MKEGSQMDIRFQIFKTEKLLIQRYSGVFSFDIYCQHMQYIMNIPGSEYIQKILIDFRDIRFEIDDVDVETVVSRVAKVRKANIKKSEGGGNIHVFLVDKPIPTVMADLFIENLPNYKYSYCSTIEKASTILKLSDSFEGLESIINNLENVYSPKK